MQLDSSHDPFPRVRDALIEAARDRRLLTYPDVAAIMGLPGSGYNMGRKVGAMADAINRSEQDAGRPMLSALLVQTQSRRPGEGFYACAIQLEIVTGFADEASKRAFWEAERDQAYAYWASSSAESATQKPFMSQARDDEQAKWRRLAKREDLETVYGIALSVPLHGQDGSGNWRYGVHPTDAHINPDVVAEFQAQIRSILIDNVQPLIDGGILSEQEVAEITSHEYSTGPDANGLTPQFFIELYKQAEPFIAGSADLLAVAEVTRRIVTGIRDWHTAKQNEIDQHYGTDGERTAHPIAEPHIVLTMPTLTALCYDDLVRRHGRTGPLAIDVHPRSHWMGYGVAAHPSGAETYTIRLTVRDSSYFYMIDGVGRVLEHFRTEGEYFKLLAIPDLLSNGERRTYYGGAEEVRTLQISQTPAKNNPD